MYNKNKKFLSTLTQNFKILPILLLVFCVSILPTLYRKIKSWIDSINATSKTDEVIKEIEDTRNGEIKVRPSYCQSVAEAVKNASSWYSDDEQTIVQQMNSLQNEKEAVFTSTYFKNQYSTSLRSFLQSKLKSDWRPDVEALGERFKDINVNIRSYII